MNTVVSPMHYLDKGMNGLHDHLSCGGTEFPRALCR
jgi:hypothetical protein